MAGVQVRYVDKVGNTIGVHALATIPAGGKLNSTAVLATGDAAKLLEFGTPAPTQVVALAAAPSSKRPVARS